MYTTTAAREHVEEIRRIKFSIGGEPNMLMEDLHQAVKNLSAELYSKDIHFLMELIQNAEDNEYPEEVNPFLEFVITSNDITNTGALATLLVFNNEKGFLPNNVESICGVGRSTKKGLRKRGYIGEKGIGFKSVFMVTAQPHIFSNGYQIKFNEKPCQQCKVGFIVPEWIEENNPMLSVIKTIYGSDTPLPTTTLVLPLKPEKVKAVKDQLSSLNPEVLLFLSKIKRLSVREDNPNSKHNTVNSIISISSEKNIVNLKSTDAESYTLHLTADNEECRYYMWKQRFPVNPENKVDDRMEVEESVITLAFPYGKRLGGSSLPAGIYSFLPTCTVTNFPFIIQADFLLASSREDIIWDNKWNQGILDYVPVAFSNAFTSLTEHVNMYWFLPVSKSSHPKLNNVRDAIKAKLMNETIIPCESPHKLLCKPTEVGRLKPEFCSIINKAMSQGMSFNDILSHVVASSFDKKEHDFILDFLEIQLIDDEWYAKCINNSNFVMGVSEDVYIELLVFIAEGWGSSFYKTIMKNTPLIKYVGQDGNNVGLVTPVSGRNKLLAADCDHISWLINWNTELGFSTGKYFLPKVTQEAIQSCSNVPTLVAWLKDEMKVSFVNVYEYAELVSRSINNSDRKLAITYAHFVYTSSQKDYFWKHEVLKLSSYMPIVDKYGQIIETRRSGVLVPGNGSRWVELIGSNNPWRHHNYIELSEDYNNITCDVTYFCDVVTSREKLFSFLKAFDVPNLSPPNAALPTLSFPLTKKNTFLLLTWVRNLTTSGVGLPEWFLSSIKNGSWLKIYSRGSPGYGPPTESFMLDSSIGHLVQYASRLVHFPIVDDMFYGDEIRNYKDELETIGVRFEETDAFCKRLMDFAKLTKDNFLSVLKFIRYVGADPRNGLLIKSMRGEKWVRTTQGDMTPDKSVLFSEKEWKVASEISNIAFIDQDYYGDELLSFKDELGLLGVVINFNNNYQLVVDKVKSRSELGGLSSEAMLLVLRCIRNVQSTDKLVEAIHNSRSMKTNSGYNPPYACCLLNPESKWGCLLQVFESFPIIDEQIYGTSIYSMSNELKKIGVVMDFEHAVEIFIRVFRNRTCLFYSIKKEEALSFLKCYRKLKKLKVKIPVDLKNCIRENKWLRTRLGGYRPPNECILFSTEMEQIAPISSQLPFIDDTNDFYGSEIHDYYVELKKFGVVTDFKNCSKFFADGLVLPQDSTTLTPATVYILLETFKELKERDKNIIGEKLSRVQKKRENNNFEKFREKLTEKNWLKTHFGYKRPDECLLFSSDWNPFLKCNDGPFIDEGFYGSKIASYKHELSFLGVITDVNYGCQLVVNHIECHSNFRTISRIYNYLSTFKWEPAVDQVNTRIWIPRGSDNNNGEWVMPHDCVLYDKNNLFDEQLYILEKFNYDKEILGFFEKTLNVKVHPSIEDYCKLWKTWEESSGRQITHNECCAFWDFVVKNWYPTTQDTLANNLLKVPVSDPNSNEIFLFDKRDVIIPDNLILTDLFLQSSRPPIFAWFPQPSLNSQITRTKLVDIYTKLGVRTLSESARKNIPDHIQHHDANSKEKIIKKGLLKLILAFLADHNLKIDPYKRHEAVNRLLALEAFESPENMTDRYRLTISSGDVVDVEPIRMIRWDKQQSKLFMQNMETSSFGHKYVIEYASHFAEEIAEGVLLLCDKEQLVPDLSELIRLGYFVDFDDEAVDFLMKTKNLHIFVEDQHYLSSTFSSSKGNLQPKKRQRHYSYELQSTKLRRQTSDPCKSILIQVSVARAGGHICNAVAQLLEARLSTSTSPTPSQ